MEKRNWDRVMDVTKGGGDEVEKSHVISHTKSTFKITFIFIPIASTESTFDVLSIYKIRNGSC